MKKEFKPLNQAEIEEINKAISEAELNTSAEIVPVLVKQINNKKISLLKKIIKVCIVTCFVLLFFGTINIANLNIIPYVLIGCGLILIITVIFKTERKMNQIITDSIISEAEKEFTNQGISETILSNGVLLFISLEDKQLVVLADENLRMSFDDARWVKVVENFQTNMQKLSLKETIVQAIKELGDICKEACPKVSNDLNEIKNEIRIKE